MGGYDSGGNVKEQGSVEEFVCLLAGLGDVGGFNLLIGDVREADQGRGLAIISNRSAGYALTSDSASLPGYCAPSGEAREQLQVRWVDWGGIESGTGDTIALSKMTLGDDDHQPKWKKVSVGEELTAEAVGASLRRATMGVSWLKRCLMSSRRILCPFFPGLGGERKHIWGCYRSVSLFQSVGRQCSIKKIRNRRRWICHTWRNCLARRCR
ncbi:hypothetical protein ASPVEDRAFT_370196 [Aspergillus versicolor CBS 583.65]|uniref:Uncharacterized protein n=1 Tax=Aspergillus versicolor CBS 583.65 TaxID=1036611 RepID=A0A1L9Q1F9_ASPVE|nr:uncharacterized protein ASPVEDRAFT_370196 [Aspergillus versicolor CBS 583.65]OJJ07559.1 hypothetical protein ASPVEDRAFT_370196 [Aspergillus versicolor CBS 583.65]